MNRSVEKRFLALVAGTVFVFIVPLFSLFLLLSSDRSTSEQTNAVTILLSANAQALAKPLWDFDKESARQITQALVSNANVIRAEVKDMTGDIDIVLPANIPLAAHNMNARVQAIVYNHPEGPKTVGSLTIWTRKINLFSDLKQKEGIFIAIFILAVMIVIAAAVIGNRLMIMRPLLKLTAAIEATRRLGSRHSVDWRSEDEMGRLANSFNAMQMQLQAEEIELKTAHSLITRIYNTTPAMLFSVDTDDRIVSVSDYWTLATGYDRQSVIGTRFGDMVDEDARQDYKAFRETQNGTPGQREHTTRFIAADGRIVDVLIHESRSPVDGGNDLLSLSVMTDITALKQSEERNRRQAITDHLTGLMNRQGFEAALDEGIVAASRQAGALACLFIDLDRFKWINDNLGHQAGDKSLRMMVAMLNHHLPDKAVAARIGGDEFAILLSCDDTDRAEQEAYDLARAIGTIFDNPFIIKGMATRLSASIGIALYPHHARTAAELLQKSDMAMYSRKRSGKNGLQVFHDGIARSTRSLAETERTIDQALRHDWFDAFLQPIVDLQTGATVGYESLMRLRHPEKGVLPPMEIISVAEETGLIHDVGKQVFGKAFEHFVELSDMSGDRTSYLTLNLSPIQIEPSLPVWLVSAVHLFNIDPARIVLEITEASFLQDNPQILTILQKLSAFGCRIALDDFGTGYSSLSYLGRFPVDIIKIDQSFIRSMTAQSTHERERSLMLIESIVAMSHKMKCRVVAEGIEDQAQCEGLKTFGVDYGQGYLFDKPLAIETLRARYARQTEIRPPAFG
ncbi:EAL domain-containing protein [Allorhizobium sp. BGMRC 0089]|uniref:EAL domain-containing protein n=1 Tax=Allorhizobium sonneratiae TaxID=2934936 RepID=UPI002034549A|nr:EAL domain-containing protein [Allorhizobium sonneratiae]MCM2291223.1 EAL domain-containing protein [Allorhizobium sonneratiae]